MSDIHKGKANAYAKCERLRARAWDAYKQGPDTKSTRLIYWAAHAEALTERDSTIKTLTEGAN